MLAVWGAHDWLHFSNEVAESQQGHSLAEAHILSVLSNLVSSSDMSNSQVHSMMDLGKKIWEC
jgi:hypothetical protein